MKRVIFASLIAAVPAAAMAETHTAADRARMADSVVEDRAEVREETIEKLNSLLRGEISAVETYRQALTKVNDQPGAPALRTFMLDHQKAVEALNSEILRLKGVPSTDSGAWGTWAQTVQATANLFGDTAALKALKEGEEHGLKEYQEALEDKYVAATVKTMIRNDFIKNQQSHIAAIDGFIAQVR